jgi:hypothetical protein
LLSPLPWKLKSVLDFMLFYCNRGRENLRELKKTDFSFHGSGDNKYIALRDHSFILSPKVFFPRGALSNQISTGFFSIGFGRC